MEDLDLDLGKFFLPLLSSRCIAHLFVAFYLLADCSIVGVCMSDHSAFPLKAGGLLGCTNFARRTMGVLQKRLLLLKVTTLFLLRISFKPSSYGILYLNRV